jgi:hypothetical protein
MERSNPWLGGKTSTNFYAFRYVLGNFNEPLGDAFILMLTCFFVITCGGIWLTGISASLYLATIYSGILMDKFDLLLSEVKWLKSVGSTEATLFKLILSPFGSV